MTNIRFGRLLKEGLRIVAARQRMTLREVEASLADEVHFSPSTVDYWCRGHVPPDQSHVETITRYCVERGSLDTQWASSLLTQAQYPNRKHLLRELFPDSKPSIFMCYERNTKPDLDIALFLSEALVLDGYTVFFESAPVIDDRWGAKIEKTLARADVAIILLSPAAVHSEVLLWELETLDQLPSDRQPDHLLVRLAYHDPLPGALEQFLTERAWTFWRDENDSARLLHDIKAAILNQPLHVDNDAKQTFLAEAGVVSLSPPQARVKPTRQQLTMPQGTMDPNSAHYVERKSDHLADRAISNAGATITIKGARQVGKSSLLVRIADRARQKGEQVAYVDFQLLQSSIHDADLFYRHFCALVTHGLGLAEEVEARWSSFLPNPVSCTQYFGSYLLDATDRPILLAMDEVDSVFAADFRSDFFGMLRSWHNQRAFDPIWKRMSLALVTSTEPYFFIDSLNQSPFNVGDVLELQDFTASQLSELNQRYGSPLEQGKEVQLMSLLAGHPYLTQRALYLIASKQISMAALLLQAADDSGPFGDHLRSLLLRLQNKPDLLAGLRHIYAEKSCTDRQLIFRLRGAGLVREIGSTLLPRCELYTEFFRRKFDD